MRFPATPRGPFPYTTFKDSSVTTSPWRSFCPLTTTFSDPPRWRNITLGKHCTRDLQFVQCWKATRYGLLSLSKLSQPDRAYGSSQKKSDGGANMVVTQTVKAQGLIANICHRVYFKLSTQNGRMTEEVRLEERGQMYRDSTFGRGGRVEGG